MVKLYLKKNKRKESIKQKKKTNNTLNVVDQLVKPLPI